jgi:hypothetical protein
MARGDPQICIRLPPDAKAFIAAQAGRNGSSQNSEIIRCIRDRMEKMATTGDWSPNSTPVVAEDHNTPKERCDAATT